MFNAKSLRNLSSNECRQKALETKRQNKLKELIIINDILHKKCSKCCSIKPLDDTYYYKYNNTSGFDAKCIMCKKQEWSYRWISVRAEKYNLPSDGYERMFEDQNKSCAICLTDVAILSIDHSHADGHVRGLLCRKCNSAIGLLNDDPNLVSRAFHYLKK